MIWPASFPWLQLIGALALEAGLFVGLAAAAQRFIASAAWRRIIWQICLIGLMLAIGAELTGVSRGLAGLFPTPKAGAGDPAQKDGTGDPANRAPSHVGVFPAGGTTTRPLSPQQIQEDALVRTWPQLPLSGNAAALESRAPSRSKIQNPKSTIQRLAGVIWLLGAAAMLGRLVLGRLLLALFCRRCQLVTNETIHRLLRELSQRVGLRSHIRLVESRCLTGPIAFGVIRPCIGLPEKFEELFNPAQKQVMLAHELAHLAARDPLWCLVTDLLVALLWWHPLLWWARSQFNRASEAAADETSLLAEGGPQVLAECLLQLGSRLGRPPPPGVWMSIEGRGLKSGLAQRVERLLRLDGRTWRPPNQRRCALIRAAAPAGLALLVICCAAWVCPPVLHTPTFNKGDNVMMTIKQSWHRSAAALALAAAFNSSQPAALAAEPAQPPLERNAPAVVAPSRNATENATNVFSLSAAGAPPLSYQWRRNGTNLDLKLIDAAKQNALRAKLERIVLDELVYDSLPLGDVIHQLIDESIKRDPEKVGVNFLFSQWRESLLPTVDPATGLPIPAAAEVVDLRAITVRIKPPLKNIRLIDALDAIAKVADRPIKYSVQEYAVVISLAPPSSDVELTGLSVRTFRIITNNFFSSVEKTFGVAISNDSPARQQNDLRLFLTKIGVNMDSASKTVFYNENTGILMVRAFPNDLDLAEAAIATLGGTTETAGALPPAGVHRTVGAGVEDTISKVLQAIGNALPPGKQ